MNTSRVRNIQNIWPPDMLSIPLCPSTVICCLSLNPPPNFSNRPRPGHPCPKLQTFQTNLWHSNYSSPYIPQYIRPMRRGMCRCHFNTVTFLKCCCKLKSHFRALGMGDIDRSRVINIISMFNFKAFKNVLSVIRSHYCGPLFSCRV